MNYGVLVVTQLAWKQYTIVLPLNHQGELVMNPIAEKIKHSKTKSTSIRIFLIPKRCCLKLPKRNHQNQFWLLSKVSFQIPAKLRPQIIDLDDSGMFKNTHTHTILMVYKWYILPIGRLYATYHLLREPETTIDP